MISAAIVRQVPTEEQRPILLFQHGVGEAFRNPKTRSIGVRNVFLQGVPKVVSAPDVFLPVDHPLMRSAFIVVAPQLPHRDSAWQDHTNDITALLDTIAGKEQRKVYIIGFCKGGRAALELGAALGAAGIVTIDASPMGDPAAQIGQNLSQCQIPFWAIWTTYPQQPPHPFLRIPAMHDALAVPAHDAGFWDDLQAPPPQAQWKSCVVMDHEPPDSRHGAICTAVSASRVPYDWLLQH